MRQSEDWAQQALGSITQVKRQEKLLGLQFLYVNYFKSLVYKMIVLTDVFKLVNIFKLQ